MGNDHTDDDLPTTQQRQDNTEPEPVRRPDRHQANAGNADQPPKPRGKSRAGSADADAKTVHVKGQRVRIEQQTTIQEIKDLVDVSDENLAYLRTGNELKALNDDDRPYDHVDDEDRLTFRSGAKKNPFGAPVA